MGNRNTSATKAGAATTNTITRSPASPRTTSDITSTGTFSSASSSVWRDTLPMTLVTSIMEWLSVYETLRLLRLCRNWRNTIYDDGHWRRLWLSQFGEHADIPPPLLLPWALPPSWSAPLTTSTSTPAVSATVAAVASSSRSSEWYHRYRRRWRCEMTWRISGMGNERVPAIPTAPAAWVPAHDYSHGSGGKKPSIFDAEMKYVGNHGVDQWSAARYIHGTRVHGIDRQHATSIAMDDRMIVTGGYKGTLCIWNMSQDYRLAATWHGVPENKQRTISTLWMDTTRDATLLAGSGNRNIVIWDMTRNGDGGPSRVLNGHKSSLRNLQGSANGVIVSCSHDKTVRVWDLREPPATECVTILNGHTSVVGGVQFDEQKIISGDFDGSLLWWDWRRLLPSSRAGATATVAANSDASKDGTGTATASIRLRKLPGFIDSLQWRDNTLIVGYFKLAAIIDLQPSSVSATATTVTMPTEDDIIGGAPIIVPVPIEDDPSLSLIAPSTSDIILSCDETIGTVRLLPGQLGSEHKAVIATDSSLQLYNTPSTSASHPLASSAVITPYGAGNATGGVRTMTSSVRSSMVTGLSPLAMTVNEQRLATTTAAGNLIVLDFDHRSFN